jgi:hypothetical protein
LKVIVCPFVSFLWSLCCLYISFDLQILITTLVYSNSSEWMKATDYRGRYMWYVMNEERIGKWLRQVEHIRGHLWHRYSVTVCESDLHHKLQWFFGNTIPGPIINAMLLKYTVLILKILLFLTCYECKILSPIPW